MLSRLIIAMLAGVLSVTMARAQDLNGRMEAELAAYAASALPPRAVISMVNGSVERRITGRAQTLIPAYAPVRTIRPGEKVSTADFAEVMAPVSHAPADAVEHLGEIEGYEARRSLAAGRPVSLQWFGAPFVVARNDIVTVSFQSAHIRLNARARALEDGAVGDVIRAMHVDGSSVIEGVVSGPKAISVN